MMNPEIEVLVREYRHRAMVFSRVLNSDATLDEKESARQSVLDMTLAIAGRLETELSKEEENE
jgi:hypothetical protein